LRILAFLIVSALLWGAWHAWLGRVLRIPAPARGVYAGLLFAAQLVAVQLALGLVGQLRLGSVLAAHAVLTGLVTYGALRSGPTAGNSGPVFRDLATPWNGALALLATFATIWIGVATWLLPPRGVDDLSYHLPPLYEYVQTGRIALLPLELRAQFGMPLGGDFLWLWPLLFLGNDTWIDGCGWLVAAYCAWIVWAIARERGVAPRDAAFVSLAFLLVPVVIAQAASNYVDLVVVAAHLALLYALLAFHRSGQSAHLAMAGIAAGFGLGVKYNMIVAVVLALPILAAGLWRHRAAVAPLRAMALFSLVAAPLPAFWMLRNLSVTGLPLYPYVLGLDGLGSVTVVPYEVAIEQGTAQMGLALSQLFAEPLRLLTFLLRDPGLGSLNGGLGVVFWGLGLPALVWCLAAALRDTRRGELVPAFLWGTAFAVMAIFLAETDVMRLAFNMRLALVVVPLGLVALGLALARIRAANAVAAAAVQAVVVLGSAAALLQLPASKLPGFDFSEALRDRLAGTVTSPQRYYLQATGDLPSLAAAFEPLDALTRDGPGWSVYMAADWRVFITAPLYGSRLQNRVWNFQPDQRDAPDALVFHAGFSGGADNLFYVRGRIEPQEVERDPRYLLLTRSGPTELWVAAGRLEDPSTRKALLAFYEWRFADDIESIRPLLGSLPPADLVVGDSRAVQALRYWQLRGEIAAPVRLVRTGRVEEAARLAAARRVISVGTSIRGAAVRVLGTASTREGTVSIYFNEVAA